MNIASVRFGMAKLANTVEIRKAADMASCCKQVVQDSGKDSVSLPSAADGGGGQGSGQGGGGGGN